jgi:hypothetical protein
MSDIQTIITICHQLNSEGKQPSVALVKGRMGKLCPLPTIISGIKSWQANPNLKEISNAEATTETHPEPTNKVEQLEIRVKQLETEMSDLRALIAELSNK